jgi:hypothetical protein
VRVSPTLGLGRSPRLTRVLRNVGLYAPLRVLAQGAPEDERRRLREARAFRRRHGAVLSAVKGDTLGQIVLFPEMSMPSLYRARVDGMLGKAFELGGARPVFVVERHDIWHEEHLRAFGFRDFVFYDDHTPTRAMVEAEAAELVQRCTSIDDVLALRAREYEVGMHAASRTLNILRVGTLDLNDAVVLRALEWALANSLAAASAAESIFSVVEPQLQVASAQNLTPWAEFYEGGLRRGVDTLYWMPAPEESSLLIRRYSYATRHDHFFTVAPETWERLRRLPWTDEDGAALTSWIMQSYAQGSLFPRKKLRGKRFKHPNELVGELALDPAKKTAFVFSHILYDATFWFGENLFPDYGTWLVETVRAATANPSLNWVVRLHPENVRRWEENAGSYSLEHVEDYRLLRDEFGALPDHVRLMTPDDDTSTASLFGFADYALTVRGTVGIEFPCFGVPVLTAGSGGYSGRGFTIDSSSADQYRARLARLQDVPGLGREEIALAQRFAHAVFHLKPVPFPSFTSELLPDEQWDRGLNSHSFDVHATTEEELRAAPDLTRFAAWALESNEVDLLAPEAPAGDPAPTQQTALLAS